MRVHVSNLGENVDFDEAFDQQKKAVDFLYQGGDCSELFLLEHAPVYTMGRNPDRHSLRDISHLPYPVKYINRGGKATFHGPGQLVCYWICPLKVFQCDIHQYVTYLEDALMKTVADWGIEARRREGLTGVWVQDRKLASIGVGIKHWISMHGIGLNVLSKAIPPFAYITPCGLDGVHMTSMEDEILRLDRDGSAFPLTCEEVGRHLVHYLGIEGA